MRTSTAAATIALTAVVATASADLVGPFPYLSIADSPFAGAGLASFALEDFEDGLLNTPGLSASAGFASSPGSATDSVDGDDGTLDGLGQAGRSLYLGVSTVTFTFEPVAGQYPTHAGLVWTDVGLVTAGSFGVSAVQLSALAPDGSTIASSSGLIFGDGDIQGQTPEDRFLGAINAGGIASITITMPDSADWEIDHVQFGVIPAPGVLSLAGPALFLGSRRRRAG